MSAVYIAIAIAAALLGADRVLKYLSRTGKLRMEGKYLRLIDRLRRGSVTDYLQFPHRRVKKRALVWNLADFMLIGGVVLTVLGLVRELFKK